PKQPPSIRLAESLTHPEDLEICHTCFKQLKYQNKKFQIDYRMIRPDGRIIWVHMDVTVIKDRVNRPVSIFGIIQDITDRKETEQALRESKKLYRSVVENTYEIISIVQDKVIRYVNPAMERIIGYTPDEMIGTEFSKFILHEDQKKALDTYHKITPDSPFQEVYSSRLKHKNGSIIVCEITAGPIAYEGKPASLMTARNITDRIKFEKDKDRLLRRFQRKALEMESLFNATRMLLEENAFEPIARHLFDTCRRLTGGKYGYVSLLNENGSKSEVQFLETDDWQGGVKAKLPMPVQGMWEAACRQDQSIVENDFKKSRWAKNLPEGHIPLENILIIRLAIDGKPAGLMGIANKPGDFTKNDANIVHTLGVLA
ncbi:MAG: PAS domain S-box protein, partial [Desulfobacteraceae bacterium]|nr:PAS domain S-box protein [Desulfobacteraceae bacterium]